jgi:hypothetical protein
MYIVLGQPQRASEQATWSIRNGSSGVMRALRLRMDHMTVSSGYHKGQSASGGRSKFVTSLVSRQLDLVLVKYIVFVRPLQMFDTYTMDFA